MKIKKLIQAHLGEDGNQKTIDNFVFKINIVVLKSKNNFGFIEKVLNHPFMKIVLENFKTSNILIEACKTVNKPATEWLITMKIDPYIQDDNGMTALMYAAKNDILLFVVKHFIYVVKDEEYLNILDKNGENALFHAIRSPKTIFELVRSKIDINHINNYSESILIYCCKNEIYSPIYTLLSNEKIDVNYIDNNEKTAAMYLVEKGRYLELKALNIRGCNYNFINIRMESVLSLFIRNLYRPSENKMNDNLFEWYILCTLVEMNCNFNLPIDDDENTAVMVFIIAKDFKTLKFVLDNVKDINLSIRNKNGENASSLYIKSDSKMKLNFIPDHPTFDYAFVDPNNNNNNNNMLMYIAMTQPSLLNKIIYKNIHSLNSVNDRHENALILATKSNNTKAVDELLRNDICIDQQDYLGNTALYYAIDLRNKEIIKKLVSKEANINIKNNEGNSPLNHAVELEDKSILELLTDPLSVFHVKEKENEDFYESKVTKKYYDQEEYLYSWISNYYSHFKITDEYLKIEERVYEDVTKTNKPPEKYYSSSDMSFLEIYLITDLVIDIFELIILV